MSECLSGLGLHVLRSSAPELLEALRTLLSDMQNFGDNNVQIFMFVRKIII